MSNIYGLLDEVDSSTDREELMTLFSNPYRTSYSRLSDEEMILRNVEDPRYVAFGHFD